MFNNLRYLIIVTLLFASSIVVADDNTLSIEITKGEAGIPIAIVPFDIEGAPDLATRPTDVIESDLELSGRFDIIPRDLHLTGEDNLNAIQYKNWRLIKAEAVVVGQVIHIGGSQYEVRFRLIDVYGEQQLVGKRFIASSDELRHVSHEISDAIYQALIGKTGSFNTRIAYVTVQRNDQGVATFYLQVADSDGWGARPILQSPEPILSPVWSPNGNWLAYVSFEQGRSIVFIQDVASGERRSIAEYSGINGAPAWSPDGQNLALSLSKDGNSEIYIKDLSTGQLRRLTNNIAIDTEPAWSPDGKRLLFTSDRPGHPQIYEVSARGGQAKRVTFDGNYNSAPAYSPDARRMTYITRRGSDFRVALYTFASGSVNVLTESSQDESPSFSPNGDMIVYATMSEGSGVLSTVSSGGKVRKILRLENGSVREPAWSPQQQR